MATSARPFSHKLEVLRCAQAIASPIVPAIRAGQAVYSPVPPAPAVNVPVQLDPQFPPPEKERMPLFPSTVPVL